MEFRMLGSLEVSESGLRVPLGGPKQRLVLAHLLIRANRLVPADTLIEEVWGEEPPEAARSALQAYVSRLRRSLGDGRLEGRPPGYVLHARPDEVDSVRFESLVREAGERDGRRGPRRAADLLDEALSLWRGRPLADLADEPSLAAEVARLQELHLAAQEERIEAALELGRPVDVAALERLTAEHPLRERLWGHLMIALYRSGRQGEGLEAYRRAREVLADELGIDPSPDLQRLHERILRQDPALELHGEPLRGYRLLEQIGQGTFGTVHRAFQPQVGREVAVKAIHAGLADDPEFIRRFEAEAQLVARLEHPRIVPIHDYWREPGAAYLVMRYLRGGSLRDQLARGPLPNDAAVRTMEQVAEALNAAHRAGVVHRDVKPENILFDEDGNAYLTDFGIAKDASAPTHTRDGAVLGTPAYIPPEQIRGEAVTPAADIYSLGLVLYEILTGRQPYPAEFEIAQLWKQVEEPVPSVHAARPDLPPAIDDVVARATAKAPFDRFPDAPALAAAFRQALGAEPARRLAAAEARNPYKGLRPFVEADAGDFFGRDELTRRLVAGMTAPSPWFLAVVGPSGSGKSSLVRAGLIPALRRGAVPGSDRWFVVEMLPGAHPFEELEAALLRVAVNPPPSLIEQLERDEFGLMRAVKRVLPPEEGELLLVIDQFEEIFTLVKDEDRRAAFLANLAAAATDPRGRIRVVVTLRADFYDRPLQYREFADLLSTRTLVVTPPSTAELEEAISGPAEAVGVGVEPSAVAEMLTDVGDQPGALPLLQFALTELFSGRQGGLLTREAYRRIGGVSGAIARRAEDLYEQQPPEGKAAARQLFLRLIAIGEGGIDDTRRRALRAELTSLEVDRDAMAAVIDAFGTHRLLSFDRDPVSRGPTVEVAHEALLREWTRLRGWIEAAREDVRMHRRLDAAAAEWARSGEDPSFLLRGARLGQFESWTAMSSLALSEPERRYLDAAIAHRDDEAAQEEVRTAREAVLERRAIVRLRAMISILTIAALVASVLSVVAVNQRSNAQRVARAATARELASAALANLDVDAERSILLALQAAAATRQDGTVVPEAVQALHSAVAADRQLMTLHDPSTANVAWSPDGRLIATGGSVGGNDQPHAILWDARTGAKLRRLRGHTGDIGYVAFSPDSSRLLATGDDDRAIVWSTRTGARLLVVPDLPNGAGTFSPDGRQMVLGAETGRITIVDARTGKLVSQRFPVETMPCQAPVFSPDGSRVAVPEDRIPIWDARTGRTLLTIDVGGSCNVVFSPDGTELASAGNDGVVTVWNAHTGDLVERLQGHTGQVVGLDWSTDGTRIASAGNDGTARIWDARTGQQQLVLSGHTGLVANIAFSPDGTRLVTGGGDGTARVWDVSPVATAEQFGAFEPGPFKAVAFDPDGTGLATSVFAQGQGTWVWNAATGERLRAYPNVFDARFSADGSKMLAVGEHLEIVDTSSGAVVRTLRLAGAYGVDFAPDGRSIALPLGTTVILANASTGHAIRSLGHAGSDDSFLVTGFSPDGRLLAAITGRATLDVWRIANGREVFQGRAATGQARSLAFSPDGRRLITTGANGATLWDARTWKPTDRLVGAGAIGTAAFSSDGKLVAAGGDDGTVRIWDASTGRQSLSLTGHTAAVTGVAFSPDGSRLATTSDDGTLRVYVLPVHELVRIARARLSRGLTGSECRQYLHLPACPNGGARGPKGSPSGTPTMPARLGPEGAYRIEIGKSDTQAPGIDLGPDELRNSLGEFTLSLSQGTWRLHLKRADSFLYRGWITLDDQVSTYTIDGRRITFEILDDTCYFGGTWSADWSVTANQLTLSDIASSVPAECHPVGFQAVISAVFGSRPLTRVT